MSDSVLQTSQFFRERIAKAEDYRKHHNGHAASDEKPDDEDEVREVDAHKNVFHRP